MADERQPMSAAEFAEAFGNLPDEYLIPIAERLAPVAWAVMRSMALPDAKNHVNVRFLHNGTEVTQNSSGVTVGLTGGKGQFDIVNFQGGSMDIDSATNARQVNVRVGGGGADCMFDFLVSSCFSTLSGFTEGMTFYSLSGCAFKGYSTFALVSADLDANSTNAGIYTVYLCGITTENVTLTPSVTNRWATLHVYGNGRNSSGIAGTVTIAGAPASSAFVHFYDLGITTLTCNGTGSTYHVVARGCAITTLSSTAAVLNGWSSSRFLDCDITTVSANGSSAWDDNQWQGCSINTFDMSAGSGLTPHTTQRLLGCHFQKTSTVNIKGGGGHQIVGCDWHGTGTPGIAITLAVGSLSLGNLICDNELPSPPTGSTCIDFTGAGTVEATITGNTFGGNANATNYIRASSTGIAIVTVTSNNFSALNNTPTFFSGQYISGKFKFSTFGPNTPSNFNLELLSGSASNLYIGLGTVSGAGASSATTAGPHTILDGLDHTDTLAGTVVRGDVIVGNSTPKWSRLAIGTANKFLRSDGTDAAWTADTRSIPFIIDGGGSTVTTGVKPSFVVPFACTITGWDIEGDAAGTCTIDVTTANDAASPSYASIVGAGTKPNVAGPAVCSTMTAPASWTSTAITANQHVQYNVTAVATFKWIVITLRVTVP